MTDNFLLKFEEKVMAILAELESSRKELSLSRKELNHLRQENSALKADKLEYTKKLQGLVSLFDTLNAEPTNVTDIATLQPQEDFAVV